MWRWKAWKEAPNGRPAVTKLSSFSFISKRHPNYPTLGWVPGARVHVSPDLEFPDRLFPANTFQTLLFNQRIWFLMTRCGYLRIMRSWKGRSKCWDPEKGKEKRKEKETSAGQEFVKRQSPLKRVDRFFGTHGDPYGHKIATLAGDDVNPKPNNFSRKSQTWEAHYKGTRYKELRNEGKWNEWNFTPCSWFVASNVKFLLASTVAPLLTLCTTPHCKNKK